MSRRRWLHVVVVVSIERGKIILRFCFQFAVGQRLVQSGIVGVTLIKLLNCLRFYCVVKLLFLSGEYIKRFILLII
jgi:hypothetical protein